MSPSTKTSPYLTKFEFCRIIGMRALELSMKKDGKEIDTNFHEVAKAEILNRELSMTVRRYLPNGNFEDRELLDLKIDTISFL